MFFYRFQNQREDQAIVQSDLQLKGLLPGSLINDMGEYFLCLGEEASRSELIQSRHSFVSPKIMIELCSSTTIEMIHWMVYERFSAYRDVVPLFFGNDIQLLLKYQKASEGNKKQQKVAGGIKKQQETTESNHKITNPAEDRTVPPKQSLYIFPTLFSLIQFSVGNTTKQTNFLTSQPLDLSTSQLILSGQSTPAQRAKAYRAIKSGQINTVFATHSQIFRDWNNLQEVHLMDEYSPLYEVHQEPRYGVGSIVKKIIDFSFTIYGNKK